MVRIGLYISSGDWWGPTGGLLWAGDKKISYVGWGEGKIPYGGSLDNSTRTQSNRRSPYTGFSFSRVGYIVAGEPGGSRFSSRVVRWRK